MPTKDDFNAFKPIWAIDPGDCLVALRTLHMEDGQRERAFTEGQSYDVLRVHPLRDPSPVAVVIDDTGQENKIDIEFIANFRHVRRDVQRG